MNQCFVTVKKVEAHNATIFRRVYKSAYVRQVESRLHISMIVPCNDFLYSIEECVTITCRRLLVAKMRSECTSLSSCCLKIISLIIDFHTLFDILTDFRRRVRIDFLASFNVFPSVVEICWMPSTLAPNSSNVTGRLTCPHSFESDRS